MKNYKEQEVAGVDIGHDDDGNITLWACEEYGDEPSRLTPSQALQVASALVRAAAHDL